MMFPMPIPPPINPWISQKFLEKYNQAVTDEFLAHHPLLAAPLIPKPTQNDWDFSPSPQSGWKLQPTPVVHEAVSEEQVSPLTEALNRQLKKLQAPKVVKKIEVPQKIQEPQKPRFRQTGRTTRMLEEAYNYALRGAQVAVIGYTRHQCDEFERIMAGIRKLPEYTSGTRIRSHNWVRVGASGGSYQFLVWSANQIDLNSWRLIGMEQSTLVLVDHSVLEAQFGSVINMWSRWVE